MNFPFLFPCSDKQNFVRVPAHVPVLLQKTKGHKEVADPLASVKPTNEQDNDIVGCESEACQVSRVLWTWREFLDIHCWREHHDPFWRDALEDQHRFPPLTNGKEEIRGLHNSLPEESVNSSAFILERDIFPDS